MRATATRLLAGLLVPALLAGCSLAPAVAPSPAYERAPVTDTLKRRLTFTPRDQQQPSRTLIGLIRLTPTGLRAALLTPYGQRLVTLVDDDAEGPRFEAGDVPPDALRDALPMSPPWLASRLQWCLWPREALDDAFAGSPWSVSVDGDARVIRHRDAIIARITPAATHAGRTETVLLDDRQGEYLLRIVPFEDSAP